MRDGLKADRAVLIAPAADGAAASRRFARAIALPEDLRAAMQKRLEQQTGREMEALAIHRVAPHLAQPALIVHDLADADVPWEEGERYARFWPDARLMSVQGLGHHKIVNDELRPRRRARLPARRVWSASAWSRPRNWIYGYA
jgi:pimeloyl-ACP methyl ester carboxylesterase